MDLCLVVPCFNERQAVETFVEEWRAALSKQDIDWRLIFVDAASTDGTVELIRSRQQDDPRLMLEVHKGLMHGPSCLAGYRMAIEAGAEWILQLDSDGQCDPRYFDQFWQNRSRDAAVQGFRSVRDDGLLRMATSRILSVVLFCLSGVLVKDANVPYRLMHRTTLAPLLPAIPDSFELTNVLLSYFYSRQFRIIWLPITFRNRTGGQAKTNVRKIFAAAVKFIREFKAAQKKLAAIERAQGQPIAGLVTSDESRDRRTI